MRTFILRRLAHTIPVLIGAATLVFLALRLIPGDPAVAMAGEKASNAEIEQIREQLGLNQPLPVQYGQFLVRTFTLQLGRSIRTGGDIREELINSFGPTIELSISALIVAIVIGLPRRRASVALSVDPALGRGQQQRRDSNRDALLHH